jgi:hypothetical protein
MFLPPRSPSHEGLRRFLRADVRGPVIGILFMCLVLSQLMVAVLYIVLLPRWQHVSRPESAVTRIEMVVRLLQSVGTAERAGLPVCGAIGTSGSATIPRRALSLHTRASRPQMRHCVGSWRRN